MGAKIRRLPRTGRLALGLHWKMPPHGPVYRTQERTGLSDTPANRRVLEREYVAPIAAEMRRRAFDRACYLSFFPGGSRAAEFRAQLGLAVQQPDPAPAPLTVADYYVAWLARKQEPHVRRSMVRDYRQHFTRYILPVLGDHALGELRLDHLVTLRNTLTEQHGLAPKTVRNVLAGSLKAMLREAQSEQLSTAYALFGALELAPAGYYQPDPFEFHQRQAVLGFYRTYQDGRHYAFVATLLLTGMRPSEATALRIGDVDLRRRTIAIVKSRNLGTEYALPKTKKSCRTIPVHDEAIAALEPLVRDADPARHLFLNRRGLPLNQDNWRADHWHVALEAAKVRPRDVYALRDTFISLTLTAGAPPIAVADYCGTSLAMIDQSYGKYIPRDPRQLLTHVEGITEAKTQSQDEAVTLSPGKPLQGGASPTGFESFPPRRRAHHTLDEKRNALGELAQVVRGYRHARR